MKVEGEEEAQICATLDPKGCHCQYTTLEAQGDYEGKPSTFLVILEVLIHSYPQA